MGQYFRYVNISKGQWFHPNTLGALLKLGEQVGTVASAAFYALLAPSSGEGGGAILLGPELTGSWGGDRIFMAGDYGPYVTDILETMSPVPGHFPKLPDDEDRDGKEALYHYAARCYEDIGWKLVAGLVEHDIHFAGEWIEEMAWRKETSVPRSRDWRWDGCPPELAKKLKARVNALVRKRRKVSQGECACPVCPWNHKAHVPGCAQFRAGC